ncbi:glycosyltransferase [Candidatus Macondimonas diazotrophica]|jgi:trehalose synthase|uniref:Glycosyltransferase n=1 Tax=Candidatus Macondimonas diazotrophica TaxID=2305248 RepID=A0A4Z0FE08_9GAMM|nr:glycosyltransferase [Candidatus Macondimonas diazotrophica]NCU01595.1 glycosyltransferase [Candidatus Macondimonas diazotrophica]TFZ84225.1 glycosyltransferase [Candidatus Macondimonas diazotrophica]
MNSLLTAYAEVAGSDVVQHLIQLAAPLRGMKIVHVNSTRAGGGVAEILHKLVPLMEALGIDTRWEVITGEESFYQCTKAIHNAMQGNPAPVPETLMRAFEDTTARNAEMLGPVLREADVVFIHDPQPVGLLRHLPDRRGKWIWRCHIDASHPQRAVWRFLRGYVADHDASVFSLADFAQRLPHPIYLIPPSIDPLSEKNIDLPAERAEAICAQQGIDSGRPLMLQVSRYDRFKDPLGVIAAYRLAKTFMPRLQLALAGGAADDDPEGEAVLADVRAAAGGDDDIKVLLLPPDAHTTINALQRSAQFVLQKSLREGFGLTVTEGMWKSKPVIGGNTGGIRLQVINHHTGFLVSTPEGAALRVRYLHQHPALCAEMGGKAREFVRQNFLITRQLRDYLTLIHALMDGRKDRIELV